MVIRVVAGHLSNSNANCIEEQLVGRGKLINFAGSIFVSPTCAVAKRLIIHGVCRYLMGQTRGNFN